MLSATRSTIATPSSNPFRARSATAMASRVVPTPRPDDPQQLRPAYDDLAFSISRRRPIKLDRASLISSYCPTFSALLRDPSDDAPDMLQPRKCGVARSTLPLYFPAPQSTTASRSDQYSTVRAGSDCRKNFRDLLPRQPPCPSPVAYGRILFVRGAACVGSVLPSFGCP